jgi:hypothetical protein
MNLEDIMLSVISQIYKEKHHMIHHVGSKTLISEQQLPETGEGLERQEVEGGWSIGLALQLGRKNKI